MGALWARLVADGLIRDVIAVAVAHVLAIPHVAIWYVRKRRKDRSPS